MKYFLLTIILTLTLTACGPSPSPLVFESNEQRIQYYLYKDYLLVCRLDDHQPMSFREFTEGKPDEQRTNPK